MKCKFIKPDGQQCQANAMKGNDFCFTHNPLTEEERAVAVIKGGLNRKHYEAYGEEVALENPADIKKLLGQVINLVFIGKMPANQPANTIGFLARAFLDAYEASEVEARLNEMEKRLEKAGL